MRLNVKDISGKWLTVENEIARLSLPSEYIIAGTAVYQQSDNKTYVYDGTQWVVLQGGGSGGSADLQAALNVTEGVGGVADGKQYATGTSLETIFRDMLNPTLNPEITGPSASISGGTPYILEVGTTKQVSFSIDFNKGKIHPLYGTEPLVDGKITTACRHKETIDRKEVRKVFLSHFTNLSNELQTRFVRVDIFPLRLYSVCSQSLEEFGIEGSVLLCKMIIEIEGMEHSETTVVDIPPIERFTPSKLLHGRTQRFACSCSVAHEPTIHIGKEVVAAFGKALQHNGELMLMSELVRSTSFIVIRDIGIQESLRGVERNVDAELVCMSYRTWRIVIHIRGIVEIAGIESIAATQIPRCSGFLTICHRLVDAEEVVLPNRKAVQTCNCFVDFVRIGFLQD